MLLKKNKNKKTHVLKKKLLNKNNFVKVRRSVTAVECNYSNVHLSPVCVLGYYDLNIYSADLRIRKKTYSSSYSLKVIGKKNLT